MDYSKLQRVVEIVEWVWGKGCGVVYGATPELSAMTRFLFSISSGVMGLTEPSG